MKPSKLEKLLKDLNLTEDEAITMLKKDKKVKQKDRGKSNRGMAVGKGGR